jgi:hypothetical protein
MTKLNLAIAVIGMSLWATAVHAQTINVCRGEYTDGRNKCLPYEKFMPCDPPLEVQVRQMCKDLGAKAKEPPYPVMRTVTGNHCGYTNYRVTCQ